MQIKSWRWGKIFLLIGLSAVAAQGMFSDLVAKGYFTTTAETITNKMLTVNKAYGKIQRRLEIFQNLIDDIYRLDDKSIVWGISTPNRLKGLFFPLSVMGPRRWPNFTLQLELRLAKKERTNIERRIEFLDLALTNIEREAKSSATEDPPENQSPKNPQELTPLQQIEMLRQHLVIDRSELNNLSEQLNKKLPK